MRGTVRVLAIGGATVAAAFLIYETFQLVRERIWRAGVGVHPANGCRSFHCHSRPSLARSDRDRSRSAIATAFGSLFCAAVVGRGVGDRIADFGAILVSATHWREHWKGSCIELFMVIIVPLSLPPSVNDLSRCSGQPDVWHGHFSMVARQRCQIGRLDVLVYPMTIAGVFWLVSWRNDLFNQGYSNWEYATRKAIARVLIALVLVVGTMVTWRCLNRSAEKGGRIARWLQGIVALIAAPFF